MRRSRDPRERVVVTGLGCITPLGRDVPSTWEAALAGRCVAGQITHFDASRFPVRIAAQITDPIVLDDVSPKDARRMDRVVRLALAASREALADAGLLAHEGVRDRFGVGIGSGIGGLDTLISNHKTLLAKGPNRVSPFTIPMSIVNMSAACVSIQHGLGGPNLCHVSACASGAHSIGESARLIARGEADVMVAGGSEAPITDIALAGFAAMRALSTRNDMPTRASRPFDRNRDGFVIAEGAGLLVLESLAHARERGVTPRAEILGYGATADATHMAAPAESGHGVARCMELALREAGLEPAQIDYVNAHATGTPAGDPIEAKALRDLLGPHADSTPVSATKSMTGHMLGASGAVEAILCIRALEAGALPPTVNLDHPDPDCALDHVAGKARLQPSRIALSNSFGFGGSNASLVLARI